MSSAQAWLLLMTLLCLRSLICVIVLVYSGEAFARIGKRQYFGRAVQYVSSLQVFATERL